LAAGVETEVETELETEAETVGSIAACGPAGV
jgi:hypothetical protein